MEVSFIKEMYWPACIWTRRLVKLAANLELLSAAKVTPANTVKMTIIAVAKNANVLNLLNILFIPQLLKVL